MSYSVAGVLAKYRVDPGTFVWSSIQPRGVMEDKKQEPDDSLTHFVLPVTIRRNQSAVHAPSSCEIVTTTTTAPLETKMVTALLQQWGYRSYGDDAKDSNQESDSGIMLLDAVRQYLYTYAQFLVNFSHNAPHTRPTEDVTATQPEGDVLLLLGTLVWHHCPQTVFPPPTSKQCDIFELSPQEDRAAVAYHTLMAELFCNQVALLAPDKVGVPTSQKGVVLTGICPHFYLCMLNAVAFAKVQRSATTFAASKAVEENCQ